MKCFRAEYVVMYSDVEGLGIPLLRLFRETMDSLSSEIFRSHLDVILSQVALGEHVSAGFGPDGPS